jgi:hypothetical protein
MKNNLKLLLLITLIFSVTQKISAETIAYWRFENGTAGSQHTGTNDDFYIDSTANSNAMSNIPTEDAPTATDTVPFSTVPATGEPNTLALDFVPNSVILTQNDITNKMVDSYVFSNGWTVEATVKFNNLTPGWPVIVGKDGKPSGGPAPPFFLKLINLDPPFIQADFFSNDNAEHWFDGRSGFGGSGETEIFPDKWYNLAVTYDGSNVAKLYIQEETDIEYELEATSQQSNIGPATFPWDTHWSIGRGVWNGGPDGWVDGIIDEVRISDVALDPTQFVAYTKILIPQPPSFKEISYSPSPEPLNTDEVTISANITTANSTLTNVTYEYKINDESWLGPFPMITNTTPDMYVGTIVSQVNYSVVSFRMSAENTDGSNATTEVYNYTVCEDIPWKTVLVSSNAVGGGYNMASMSIGPDGLAGFVYRSAVENKAKYIEESALGIIETPVDISTNSQGFFSDIIFNTNNEPRVILSYDVDSNGGLTYVQRTNGVWTSPMMIITNYDNDYRGVITISKDQKSSVLWYDNAGTYGDLIDINLAGNSFSSAEITNEVAAKPDTKIPFGMITGTDGKRRIALSTLGTISLCTETSVNSGEFDWETIASSNVYVIQMGFALDADNKAYIACCDDTTIPKTALLFENSSGLWVKHSLGPIDYWSHCSIAINPDDNSVWVAHNAPMIAVPQGLRLWSNRDNPNIWKKELSITNGVFVDSISGFEFTELGTMKIAFKPTWYSQELVYMYSTKFTLPEGGIIFMIFNFGFLIYYLRKFNS